MNPGPTIETERLTLRRWHEADLGPFAALNSDPVVMKHFPRLLDLSGTEQKIATFEESFETHGYGMWAVEITESKVFIGCCGLVHRTADIHLVSAVDVGWGLLREHWGHGYATEAATAALAYGFNVVGLDEIVSFTVPQNEPSRRVMERLGMTHDPEDDFDHPNFLEDARLRRHVLYRMSAARWAERNPA